MKKALVILLALWLTLSVSGCDSGKPQTELIKDFFRDYGFTLLGRQFTAATRLERDEEAEAVLGAAALIATLLAADKLMDEGRHKEDPEKMDQAIRMRPGDYTYHISRAALALQRNEMVTYSIESHAADTLVEDQDISQTVYSRYQVKDLEYVESRLRIDGFQNREQCEMVYTGLQAQYEKLLRLTSDMAYDTRARWASEKFEGCSAVPE
jgi:hypothetical protein